VKFDRNGRRVSVVQQPSAAPEPSPAHEPAAAQTG
jgi:hypothetical protein